MLCLLMKCGTRVGLEGETDEPPRSTELYTKNLTLCLSASSIRALPCVSSWASLAIATAFFLDG